MEAEEVLQGAKEIHDINEILKKYGKYVIELDQSDEHNNKAYQDIQVLGYLGLSKFPKSEHWGDDWNDSPASCNAGNAYPKEGDSYENIEIRDKTMIFSQKEVAELAIEIYRYLKGIKNG